MGTAILAAAARRDASPHLATAERRPYQTRPSLTGSDETPSLAEVGQLDAALLQQVGADDEAEGQSLEM